MYRLKEKVNLRQIKLVDLPNDEDFAGKHVTVDSAICIIQCCMLRETFYHSVEFLSHTVG